MPDKRMLFSLSLVLFVFLFSQPASAGWSGPPDVPAKAMPGMFAHVSALPLMAQAIFSEPQDDGGSEGGNQTLPTENVTIAINYFNDSARSPGNSTDRFSAGDTAYYTLCVYNETDNSTLTGWVTFYREYHFDTFHVNGCYDGTFAIENTDHSGWWRVNAAFTNDTVLSVYWNPQEYIVEPVLTMMLISPFSELSCPYPKSDFAPGDALNIHLIPLDQAYRPVDQGLFGYDFFDRTDVRVYNRTDGWDGDVDTVIYDQTFGDLAIYEYNCTDPETGETSHIILPNVADGMVLPDNYEQWFVDVDVQSAYGNMGVYSSIDMPIYPANASLSIAGPINPGRNMTVSFDGWVNARGEAVSPDSNEFVLVEWNVTCYEYDFCYYEYVDELPAGSGLTGPVSFIVEKNGSANAGTLGVITTLGDYTAYTLVPNTDINLTSSLDAVLSVPATATKGELIPVTLNVQWANGDPYEGLGNLTALLSKPSGPVDVTLQEQGSGVYAANLTADQTGTWNLTADLTDAYNNTGSAAATIIVNPDVTAPTYSDQGQNSSNPMNGTAVMLYVQWADNIGLETAVLETNETGSFANSTTMNMSGTSAWSNFTWQNTSLADGTVVSWRAYATDTSGNANMTELMSFTLTPPGPVCGNGVCEAGEGCGGCSADCGQCYSGGGGGGIYNPVNKTKAASQAPNTTASKSVVDATPDTQATQVQPATGPAAQPEPEILPEERPAAEPAGPTGLFAAGAGIASAIQSFLNSVVNFFAGLFGLI